MSEDQRIWVFNDTEQRRSEGTYEQFWQVKNPYLLAKKVLDKSSARKYFSFETLYKGLYSKTNQSVRVDFKMKDQIHKELAKEASKKNLMGIFAEKDTRMIKLKKMKKLVRIKLQEKTTLSTEECLQVWMHCSGSADQMRTNQGYYQRLLTQKYMDYYRIDIMKDVNRSTQLVDNPEQLLKLENILIAYARRNAYIGYCQGMNYIVAKFLKLGLSEEESFWLLTQLLEDVLPLDYFTGVLVGVVCDSRILEQLLRRREETLFKKLAGSPENAVTILLTSWIMTLFTQSLNDQFLQIVWNMLFSKGSVTIFKVCLVLLDHCKKEILHAQEYGQVKAVETKLKNWKDTKEFKKRLDRIYVNERGIDFMRELYRQVCMIQLEERAAKKAQQPPRRLLNNNPKPPILCDQTLPICLQLMESQSGKTTDKLPPDFFIFKTQREFKIDHRYFEAIRTKDKRNVGLDEMDIMQTLQEHICQPTQKVEEIKEEIEEEEGKGQEDEGITVAAVIRVKNSRENKTSSLGGKEEGEKQGKIGEFEEEILENKDERNEEHMENKKEEKTGLSNESTSPQQYAEIFMSNDHEFLQEYAQQYDYQNQDLEGDNNKKNSNEAVVAVVNNNTTSSNLNTQKINDDDGQDAPQVTLQNDSIITERHFSRGRQLTADFNILKRSQNGTNNYQQQQKQQLEKPFYHAEGSGNDKQANFASQQFNKFNSNNYITYCNPNNNNKNNNKTMIESSSTGNWANRSENKNQLNKFQAADQNEDEDSHSMQFYSKITRSRKDYTYLVTAKQHPILDDEQPIHNDGRALSS